MNIKGPDQTVWMHRLICRFVVRICHRTAYLMKWLILIDHIIIITLFQEDNIFGINASLTYDSDTKTYMHLIITDRTKIIYSIYLAGEVSIHRGCCERATQPYSLGGGGTIYLGSRQQMLPHIRGWYRFTVYIENRYLRIDICIEPNMSVSKKNIDHQCKWSNIVYFNRKATRKFRNCDNSG